MKGPTSISYAKLGYWRIGGILEHFYVVENVSELQKSSSSKPSDYHCWEWK